MSIIQQIRDKAAWLVFGLIAVSLIGFLLMDASVGKSRIFGGNTTTVGEVNGEKIEYAKYQQEISAREDQYKAQGYPVNEMMQQNIREGVWKEKVEDVVLTDIYKKLGLDISDKELSDLLFGPDAIPDIKKSFTDPKTGIFDAQAAASTIKQLQTIYKGNKKTDKGYDEAKRFFEEGIPQIIKGRQKEKFISLIATSVYVPKWLVEKTNAENSQISSISYVSIPYSTISDSTVKVTDDDISTYIGKRKDQFKQVESRSIEYVAFSAAPTLADSTNIRQQLVNLKAEFESSKDPQAFISRNGSEVQYYDGFLAKTKIQVPSKDSIFNLAKGAVYGPYLDAGNYVLAKLIDEKTMPDSVKARHILVSTVDARTGQPLMDDSTAKKKIDSIRLLIEHGQRFDSVAAKLSDDQGSKEKGGELGYFSSGQMVKEFNDFCFDGKTGDKKIIKSQYGYHYVEIEDQKSFGPAYKIAYLAHKIDASPETDANAQGLAQQFAGESRTLKAFEENLQKRQLPKLMANDILPTDNTIQALGTSRQFIRDIYDAKLGDVLEQPENIGDKYVVAVVTEINKEGLMSVAKARPLVELKIRNEKKADIITNTIGTPASLDAVVTKEPNTQIKKADSISFSSPYIPNLGQEARIVGASFNKQWVGKVSPALVGNAGVYVIKIDNLSAKPNLNGDIDQLRISQEQMQTSIVTRQELEVLRKSATVKDYRGKFF